LSEAEIELIADVLSLVGFILLKGVFQHRY